MQRLRLVDEKIGDRDIRIAIEPLYELESNIVITAQEGLKLVREVDQENIRLLIDYYHLCVEKEDQSIIEKAKDYLQHMHLANSTGRVYPIAGDGVNYRTFISNLKKAGYDSRISIDPYTNNFAGSAVVAMAAVRHATR